jgi:hypothetical protein
MIDHAAKPDTVDVRGAVRSQAKCNTWRTWGAAQLGNHNAALDPNSPSLTVRLHSNRTGALAGFRPSLPRPPAVSAGRIRDNTAIPLMGLPLAVDTPHPCCALPRNLSHVMVQQIALFCVSWVAALFFLLFMLRPILRKAQSEMRQVAELLSQLPPEIDCEGMVMAVTIGDKAAKGKGTMAGGGNSPVVYGISAGAAASTHGGVPMAGGAGGAGPGSGYKQTGTRKKLDTVSLTACRALP